jgi:FkbM family methyltransferase
MYSQEDEEKHILAAFAVPWKQSHDFGGRDAAQRAGRFLDIGAGDPFDKSNTRALFELGWSGVMIEPSPRYMEALLLEYKFEPRIQLVSAVVALSRGIFNLKVSDQPSSTIGPMLKPSDRTDVTYYGSMLVLALPPEDISNKFGGFDFINIDAEGVSSEIFLRIMELDWDARCICVEHDERTTELLKAATKRGYRCTYANGTNLIVVKG